MLYYGECDEQEAVQAVHHELETPVKPRPARAPLTWIERKHYGCDISG